MITDQEKRWLDRIVIALDTIYTLAITLADKNNLAYSLLQSHCTGSVSVSTFKLTLRIREHYQDMEVS